MTFANSPNKVEVGEKYTYVFFMTMDDYNLMAFANRFPYNADIYVYTYPFLNNAQLLKTLLPAPKFSAF